MERKIKLGISTCLLGENVRFDGGHKLDRFLTDTLGQYVEYVPVCPEVECGLPVPRESMHLEGDLASPRLVTSRTKQDMTEKMVNWAWRRVNELEKEGPKMRPADKQEKEKRLVALVQQFQQMQRSLLEDLDVRKREERARFLAEVNVIIKGIAEAGKFDLVVQQAIYSSSQIDITDQVLKEMAKRAAAAGAPGK